MSTAIERELRRSDIGRSGTDEDRELLDAVVESSLERTGYIIYSICDPAIDERRDLTDEESTALYHRIDTMPEPVITPEDALDIVSPGEDWFHIDGIEEGLRNHADYHLGRPGECGGGCPALLLIAEPLPAETMADPTADSAG